MSANFVCISTGDFIRAENVVAITARDKEDKWNAAMVTIYIRDDMRINLVCDTFAAAQNLRDEIIADIENYLFR